MTMPKKGTRSLTVNKKVYRFQTKSQYLGPEKDYGTRLIIESPDGKLKVIWYDDRESITPADVRKAILESGL